MGVPRSAWLVMRHALKDAGVPVDPQLVCEGDFLQLQGYQCTQTLLNLAEAPTAIFASNDVMAFGVMEAARERGLRLPEDLSIVGFDDIPQAGHVHPLLTTVRQPLEEMGRVSCLIAFEIYCSAGCGHRTYQTAN